MKNTGTLRIQTFAARQSAPMEGVTVAVQGDGFTLHCITDATGSAADIPVEAPACTLSLDEDNTIRPYAVVSLTAAKSGYRTVRIEGIQIFAGQITLAQPAMIPVTEEGKDIPDAPIVIPPHPLFAGSGGSGAQPVENCTPRVLDQGRSSPKTSRCIWANRLPAARNVTVSFRDYIANVASSEVYPTWADENTPTGHPELFFGSEIPFNRYFLLTRSAHPSARPLTRSHQQHCKLPGQVRNLCQFPHTLHLRLERTSRFLRLLFQLGFQAFRILAFCTAYFIEETTCSSLKNCAESIRPDTLSRYSSCNAFRRRSASPSQPLRSSLPHCLMSSAAPGHPARAASLFPGRTQSDCVCTDTLPHGVFQMLFRFSAGLVAAHVPAHAGASGSGHSVFECHPLLADGQSAP